MKFSTGLLILVGLLTTSQISSQNEIVDKMEVDLKRTSTDILVRSIESESDVEFTHVNFTASEMDMKYQVELNVQVTDQISFSDCQFSIQHFDGHEECLDTFTPVINEPNFVLKIDRRFFKNGVIISHRLIITGCDKETQLRKINFKPNLPKIIHKQDHDCIYSIDMKDFPTDMLKVAIKNFPHMNEHACDAFVQISNANDENDTVGTAQAFFESMNTIKEFDSDVFVTHRFTLLRLTNCYANSETIDIDVQRIEKSADSFSSLTNRGNVTSPLEKRSHLMEISRPNSNFNIKIAEFAPLAHGRDPRNTKLVIYGVDEYKHLNWFRFTSENQSIPFKEINFNGYDQIYVQFTRRFEEDKYKLAIDIKPIETTLRRFSNPSGEFNSQKEVLSSLRGRSLRFEIETPVGTQIIFKLKHFNTKLHQKENKFQALTKAVHNTTCLSNDFVIVNINKETQRLGALYSPNTNPKICDSINQPQVFRSFSNKLVISVSFSDNYVGSDQPFINFEYTSEKFCGVSNALNDVIKYNSLGGFESKECVREIQLPEEYRIIMYRFDWKLNEQGFLFDQTDHDSQVVNGNILCKDSNVMSLSESADDHKTDSVYCMENPLSTFASKNNKLFMKFAPPKTESKPLVFETGYFGIKYLYNDKGANNISINFAEIIPAHIADKEFNFTTNFEIRVQVPNKDNYFMPVLYDCNLAVDTGKLVIQTENNKKYDFSNKWCGKGVVIGEMNTELTFRFIDVSLKELRSRAVQFRVFYKEIPRVLKTKSGQFASNNFALDYLTRSNDQIAYKWNIQFDREHFINLNIAKLLNKKNIKELNIRDEMRNNVLYDINEIFKLPIEKNFTISTSHLSIEFMHHKNIGRRSGLDKLARVVFKYEATPRVIDVASSGSIQVSDNIIKEKLSWLLIAPKNHFIVAKIKEFEGNGQLKFSLIKNHQSGTFFFEESNRMTHDYDKKTTIIISNKNSLQLDYLPKFELTKFNSDSFSIVYSTHKNILTESIGLLKPFVNDLVTPVILTPRGTEQTRTIRASYGKTINVYTRFYDLLLEEKCSNSRISFFDGRNQQIAMKCGSLDLENDFQNSNLTKKLLVKSNTNELKMQFKTHNYKDVVYKTENTERELFKGYELFYTFSEDNGDCYFQKNSKLKCGYKDLTGSWNIENTGQLDKVYKDLVCFNCFLKSEIPLSSIESESRMVSPVINMKKEYLKIHYELSRNAKLSLHFIYEQDFKTGSLDRMVFIRNIHSAEALRHITLRLGKAEQDYRLIFTLSKNEEEVDSLAPSVSITSIELFEHHFDCESNEFPEHCLRRQIKDTTQKLCKNKLTACSQNMCLNGAICLNENTDYKCICPIGYTGRNCETKLDACYSNQCSVNSKCVPSLTEVNGKFYTCECDLNYHGDLCDTKLQPCKLLDDPCNQKNGHGKCLNIATHLEPMKFKCECSPKYTGVECEEKLAVDCAENCQDFDKLATCSQVKSETVCKCSAGFRGDRCQESVDDCSGLPCQNNGTCIDGINSFRCECNSLYKGQYCETAKVCNECNPSGTKYCDHKSSRCVCLETHEGELCEKSVDPCLQNPCFNNGECFSNKVDKDSWQCECPAEFKGKRCEIKKNECDHIECLNGGTNVCVPGSLNSTDVCSCTNNFHGKYCEIYTPPCDLNPCANGECSNLQDGYKCSCLPGMTGKNCDTRINQCTDSSCQNDSTCVTLLDSFICVCKTGTIGQFCEKIEDVCQQNFCENGMCIPDSVGTGYQCQCHQGYEGEFCNRKIDSCDNSKCGKGKCIDMFDSYECLCPLGHGGSGCSKLDYCSLESTKCVFENTKYCINTEAGNRCFCQDGFAGEQCERTLNVCDSKPCHNSGHCVNVGINDYRCENCTIGYTGKNCNEIVDHCELSNPCEYGGECLPKLDGYFCKCQEGYEGENCTEKVDLECSKNKCRNNSKCVPKRVKFPDMINPSGYVCECSEDHEGEYCEKQKDLCENVKCDYGFCEKGKCICPPSMSLCTKFHKCNDYKCENGGTCVDLIVGEATEARCLCPPGLTGEKCELSTYCEKIGDRICGINNKCKLYNGSYTCDCELPTIGHGCQNKLEDFVPGYVMQLKTHRSKTLMDSCRFGASTESQVFIGTVLVFLVIFAMIGFLTGHRVIVKYKRKFKSTSFSGTYSDRSLIVNSGYSNDNEYKTPKKTVVAQEITGTFSIPRPSIRAYV